MQSTETKIKMVIPLPPRELSPNYTVGSRGQRMGKAVKVKHYRAMAKESAMVAAYEYKEVASTMPWHAATTRVTFFHKDSRRRDTDNLLASLKAAFDGIRDAGLLVDDDQLTHLPVKREVDKQRPRVEIELIRGE